MSDTKQLEALREQARSFIRECGSEPHQHTASTVEVLCDRAIAALTAEKACAGFLCAAGKREGLTVCASGCQLSGPCYHCSAPKKAHQQPSAEQAPVGGPCYATEIGAPPCRCSNCVAEQAQQPAPADVPEPDAGTPACEFSSLESVVSEAAYGEMHAACVRLAQERDDAREDCDRWMPGPCCGNESTCKNRCVHATRYERDRANKAIYERDESRRELDVAKAEWWSPKDHNESNAKCRSEGRNAASREWKPLHDALALRADAAEARAELAEAELAALLAQEPVAFSWVMSGDWHARHIGDPVGRPETVRTTNLYAAPVASIPLAQHEAALKSLADAMDRTHQAALAQARREERERCAKRCVLIAVTRASRGWSVTAQECAAAIRALPDAGGEG
tara:strand:+ start:184 stop:1365 length:1182 start_codon:yes stop_codon:yes gene_type:complete